MLRPVNYFVEDLGPDIRQILAVGNPVLFWGTMDDPLLRVGVVAQARLDARFMVVAFAGLYLPWFLVADRSSSSTRCRSHRSWRSPPCTRCATSPRRTS